MDNSAKTKRTKAILVVEPNEGIAGYLAQLLNDITPGYETIIVSNGAQAVERFEKQSETISLLIVAEVSWRAFYALKKAGYMLGAILFTAGFVEDKPTAEEMSKFIMVLNKTDTSGLANAIKSNLYM